MTCTFTITSAQICVSGDDWSNVYVGGQLIGNFPYAGAPGTSGAANPTCMSVPISLMTGTQVCLAIYTQNTAPQNTFSSWDLDITCSNGQHSEIASSGSGISLDYVSGCDPCAAPANDASGNPWYATNYSGSAFSSSHCSSGVTVSTWAAQLFNPVSGAALPFISNNCSGDYGTSDGALYWRQCTAIPAPSPTLGPPSFTITKSEAGTWYGGQNYVITYTIAVCNTGGPVTNGGVTIADNFLTNVATNGNPFQFGCWGYGDTSQPYTMCYFSSTSGIGNEPTASGSSMIFPSFGNGCATLSAAVSDFYFIPIPNPGSTCLTFVDQAHLSYTGGSMNSNSATMIITCVPTSTPTAIPTFTPTSTLTPCGYPGNTCTPTPNLQLIDDFNGTGGSGSDSVSNICVVLDQNGNWRDGYWYAASGDGSTVISSGSGTVDTTCIEYATTFSTYAQLIFTFTNPLGTRNAGVSYYDATVGGRYTGISFWGKAKTLPSSICGSAMPMWVDFVDNQPVSEHTIAVPFTTSWQQYTIYFNQAGWDQVNGTSDGNSVTLNPGSIMAVKFEPQNLLTSNFNVDFLIDDIQLVSSAVPAAPTPIPANLIDDFGEGKNIVITYNGLPFYAGTSSGRDGPWFVYADTTGTNECPNGVNQSGFFPDAPGYGGPMDFALHYAGTTIMAGGWAGGGCDFSQTGSNVSKYNGSSFSGITYYVKSAYSNSYMAMLSDDWTECPVGCSGAASLCGTTGYPLCYADATYNAGTALTVWTKVTIPFTGFGNPGWGWTAITVTPPDTANLYGLKFQLGNTSSATANYDLWVDNVSFY